MAIGNIGECKDISIGCFASDPNALDYVSFNGDMGIARNGQALVDGAVEAAQQGVPFEEATYKLVSFVNLMNGEEGSPRPISDLAEEGERGTMKLRAARCAYVCGSSAVGHCPLIKQ